MLHWLFKHRHKWETTHTNRWQHPTRQRCTKCGVTREIESVDLGDCKWVYSDDTPDSEIIPWGKQ